MFALSVRTLMEGLRRRWFLAPLMLAPAVPLLLWSLAGSRSDPSGIRLSVDVSQRRLTVFEGERVIRRYGVAVGRPSNPTPRGYFRTGQVVWNPSWTPPPSRWARGKRYQPPNSPNNPMQGVKIYFKAPWYYIHGTNSPGSIGEAASRGCIRMIPDDAVALARIISRAGGGVPLVIHD